MRIGFGRRGRGRWTLGSWKAEGKGMVDVKGGVERGGRGEEEVNWVSRGRGSCRR